MCGEKLIQTKAKKDENDEKREKDPQQKILTPSQGMTMTTTGGRQAR